MVNRKDRLLGKNSKNIALVSQYEGVSPIASEIPGDSIDEHRNIETANIYMTGEELTQQNENL